MFGNILDEVVVVRSDRLLLAIPVGAPRKIDGVPQPCDGPFFCWLDSRQFQKPTDVAVRNHVSLRRLVYSGLVGFAGAERSLRLVA